MHRVTATATVLLALALGGATTAEPLRTLAPGKLRVGTYFVNPLTAMRRDGSINQLKEKWGVW